MQFGSLVLGLAVLSFAPLAGGQTYKWVDEKGVTHYGDKPPAQKPATAVTAPTSPAAPAAAGAASGAPPRAFKECASQACEKAFRVDPTCRTSLCQEAMTLPDDCHTITCQGKRAELDRRIAQMDQSQRDSAARAEQRRSAPSAAAQRQSGEAQLQARAYARCKANRGVDCDTPRGLAPWIREERPITPEQQRAAAAARRAGGN